jgi:hypothetical protein
VGLLAFDADFDLVRNALEASPIALIPLKIHYLTPNEQPELDFWESVRTIDVQIAQGSLEYLEESDEEDESEDEENESGEFLVLSSCSAPKF